MIIKSTKYFSIYSNIEASFTIVTNNQDFYNIPGIYLIKNTITNDCYVGQSKSVGNRLMGHKNLLVHNNHRYRDGQLSLLQKSWNKYGKDAFMFYLVSPYTEQDLNKQEIYWIKYFDCNYLKSGKGFNLTDGGENPPLGPSKGRICLHNPETNKTIYVKKEQVDDYLLNGYLKGRANNEEIVRKSLETKKLHGYTSSAMKGKTHDTEWKQKMSEKMTGRICIYLGNSEKRIYKTDLDKYLALGWQVGASPKVIRGKYEHKKGYKQDPKIVEKQAMAKWKPVLQYDLDGNFIAEYSSLKETVIQTGLTQRIIWKILHNKLKKNKYGFIFKYKER